MSDYVGKVISDGNQEFIIKDFKFTGLGTNLADMSVIKHVVITTECGEVFSTTEDTINECLVGG